jgi:hypothetical protein
MGKGKVAGSNERLLVLLRALSPEALRALVTELVPPAARPDPAGPSRERRPRRRTP